VEKDGTSFGGNAWLLIQDGGTFGLHIGKCGVDIIYFQADMVEAFAALFQELCQAGVRIGWLNQFDFAAAGSTQREKGDAYLLRGHYFDLTRHNAQCVPVKGEGLFDVANDDGNMVNTSGHEKFRFLEADKSAPTHEKLRS
jgi:hypothetical protein